MLYHASTPFVLHHISIMFRSGPNEFKILTLTLGQPDLLVQDTINPVPLSENTCEFC